MRDVTKTVFTFDELDEAAQDRAVELIREKFAGDWWDSSDIDDIAAEIHLAFAEGLGSPGSSESGPADFDDIDGVTLEAWDTDHLTVSFRGVLHRDNAPNLPWVEDINDVTLTGSRRQGSIYVNVGEMGDGLRPLIDEFACEEMRRAVQDLLDVAILAGRAEFEHKTSDEVARDWCENNESQEYEEDGTLA